MSAAEPLSPAPQSPLPPPSSYTPRLGFLNITINYVLASSTSQIKQRNYDETDIEFNRRLLEWIADSNELKCLNQGQRFKLFMAFVLNLLIDYLSSLDRENEDVESKLSELCQLVFDDQDDGEESLCAFKKELNDLRCLVYQHLACLVDLNFLSVHKQSMIEIVQKHSNLRANPSGCRLPTIEIVKTTSFYQIVDKMNESREQLCRDMEEYVKTFVVSKSSSVLYQLSKHYDQLEDQDGDEYELIYDFLPTPQRRNSEKLEREPPLTRCSSRDATMARNDELSDTESEETSRATRKKNVGGQTKTNKLRYSRWSKAENKCLRDGVKKFTTDDGKIDWDGILNEYKEVFVNRDKTSIVNKWQRFVKKGIEKPFRQRIKTYSELLDSESEETSRAESSKNVGGHTRSRFARWSDAEKKCLRKGVKKLRTGGGCVNWDLILSEYKDIFVNRDKASLINQWQRLVMKGIEKPIRKRIETFSESSDKESTNQDNRDSHVQRISV